MIAIYLITLLILGGCQSESSYQMDLSATTPTQDYKPLKDKPLTHNLNIAISESKEIDRHTAIRVIINDNKAILLGQSPKSAYADEAELIVAQNPQIESVYNYITIESPISKSTRVKDMALQTKIKRQLRRSNALPSGTSLEVENGMVYVIGKYSIPELSNLEESIKKADDTAPIIPIMIQNDHLLMSSPEINIPEELQS